MEGNRQKMREALVEISKLADDWEIAVTKAGALDRIYELANAALSAPARQCDVGTAEEQAKRMDAYCASHGERIGCSWRCDTCPLCKIDRCELAWAQTPYATEEGAGK